MDRQHYLAEFDRRNGLAAPRRAPWRSARRALGAAIGHVPGRDGAGPVSVRGVWLAVNVLAVAGCLLLAFGHY